MEILVFTLKAFGTLSLWFAGLIIFVMFFMFLFNRLHDYDEDSYYEEIGNGMSVYLFGFAVLLYFLLTMIVLYLIN